VQCSSRISACRRGLNSHEAAADSEETGLRPTPRRGAGAPSRRDRKAQGQKARGRNNADAGYESDDWEPPCYIGTPRCVGGHRLQSVRWVASSIGASAYSQVSGRLECAPRRRRHRGAARRRAGTGNYGPHRSRLWYPGRGLTPRSKRGPTALHLARAAPGVHDAPRGQGAMPLVPPQLER